MPSFKTFAVTVGDPAGIGPEITVKAMQRIDEMPEARFVVIGSLIALEKAAMLLGVALPDDNRITYVTIEHEDSAMLAYQSIDQAVRLVAEGSVHAIVTGPISKIKSDSGTANGHTEILEQLAHKYFNVPDARAEMLFVYKNFRLLLLTRHIALQDVPAALAKAGAVARPLKTLIRFLRQQAGIEDPNIAMLGVNPHAGEVGGVEEKSFLLPVIHAVNGIGNSRLAGPFAADAFFRGFDPEAPQFDAVVAAYHDQGLIPFKLLAGFDAVNVTIGLPFIRTSVSHGTAADIAGQNMAREDSMIAAIKTAQTLVIT